MKPGVPPARLRGRVTTAAEPAQQALTGPPNRPMTVIPFKPGVPAARLRGRVTVPRAVVDQEAPVTLWPGSTLPVRLPFRLGTPLVPAPPAPVGPPPAPPIVLSLVGLNYNISDYMPDCLYGIFAKPPYTMRQVRYPASLDASSIPVGVGNLDDAVKGVPGPKIVFAHSQGAQIASRWIREHRNDPAAPSPADLRFVLIGNPLRATGGYAIGKAEVDGEIGQPTPLDSPWPITDFCRRYDGWADPPTDKGSIWAKRNAASGMITHHNGQFYAAVRLNDPTHTVWSIGNTTFVLTKEDLPPVIASWILIGSQGDAVRSAFRRHIEKAYNNRPPHDPPSIVSPLPNQFWVWALNSLGVNYS